MYLPNKEYFSDHKYERADMVAECKIFVIVTECFIGIRIVYRYTHVQFQKLSHK